MLKSPPLKPTLVPVRTVVFALHGEVTVYAIRDVRNVLYPGFEKLPLTKRPPINEWHAKVREWASEHGAYMYDRHENEFTNVGAAFEAERNGYRRVVVENLSNVLE